MGKCEEKLSQKQQNKEIKSHRFCIVFDENFPKCPQIKMIVCKNCFKIMSKNETLGKKKSVNNYITAFLSFFDKILWKNNLKLT